MLIIPPSYYAACQTALAHHSRLRSSSRWRRKRDVRGCYYGMKLMWKLLINERFNICSALRCSLERVLSSEGRRERKVEILVWFKACMARRVWYIFTAVQDPTSIYARLLHHRSFSSTNLTFTWITQNRTCYWNQRTPHNLTSWQSYIKYEWMSTSKSSLSEDALLLPNSRI